MKSTPKSHLFDLPLEQLIDHMDIQLNSVQNAASLSFKRADRFVENSDYAKDLIQLCQLFFGDKDKNRLVGLDHQYQAMRDYVIKQNLIGLVLCGINRVSVEINTYINPNGNLVRLSLASITRVLLRYYFGESEIENLCKQTPNFNLYINH